MNKIIPKERLEKKRIKKLDPKGEFLIAQYGHDIKREKKK